MWVDESGYFYNEDLPFNKKVEPLNLEYVGKITEVNNKKEILFLNAGGTIVSGPDYENTQGVLPYRNIPKIDPYFEELAYKDLICKLSEKWTLEDYLYLKKEVEQLSKKYKKIIFTCGTDNVSFIAPYINLLCIYYNFKAVVLTSQKSMDKPTSDLRFLVDSADQIFKKLKIRNCVVCIAQIDKIALYNPFQIRKAHTTKRDGFYAKTKTFFRGTAFKDFSKQIPLFEFKNPQDLSIYVESPLQEYSTEGTQIILARGVGNTKHDIKPNQICTTIVGSGPLNTKIYNSSAKDYKIQFSWEALAVIGTFTSINLINLI